MACSAKPWYSASYTTLHACCVVPCVLTEEMRAYAAQAEPQQATLLGDKHANACFCTLTTPAYAACTLTCRHLASAYGAGWRTDGSLDRTLQQAPDWLPIQEALLTRLAVTAWGDTPWAERVSRCAAGRPEATAATAPAAAGVAVEGVPQQEEAEDATDANAVGMLQEQLLQQHDSGDIHMELQEQPADLAQQQQQVQWAPKQANPVSQPARAETLSVSQSSQQHRRLQHTLM